MYAESFYQHHAEWQLLRHSPTDEVKSDDGFTVLLNLFGATTSWRWFNRQFEKKKTLKTCEEQMDR